MLATLAACLIAAQPASAPAQGIVRLGGAKEVVSRVAANRGKVTVLEVWATWCVPCRREFPTLVRLAEKLGPRGLAIVSVNVDGFAKLASDVEPFLFKHDPPFAVFAVDMPEPDALVAVIDKRWDGTIPATFIYNKRGALVRSYLGPAGEGTLRAVLDELLAQ